jgi:hypothetical protein
MGRSRSKSPRRKHKSKKHKSRRDREYSRYVKKFVMALSDNCILVQNDTVTAASVMILTTVSIDTNGLEN